MPRKVRVELLGAVYHSLHGGNTRDERDRIIGFQKGSNQAVNPMEDGRGDHYWYDAEGQLTDAYYGATDPITNPHSPVRVDYFPYDQLGNRTGSNLLASKGWQNFTRKDNGLNQYSGWWPYCFIKYDDDIGGTWGAPGQANGVIMQDGWITGGFNALNQPILIGSPSNPSWTWFGYDPLGRCVKRWFAQGDGSGASGQTYSYYDGWNLVQEGPNAGTASRLYYHGGRMDEIVASYDATTDVMAYHYYDASGHCTLLTDWTGAIKEQYYYDAFGYPYFYNASGGWLGYSPHGNRFLFTGREWLPNLKLYDYRNRLYQPELGRFLQPDPKQFAAGDYNLYRYCHNDPVNKSDPMGLDAPAVVVKDPQRKTVIESNLKDLLKLPAFKQHFDKTKKDNVIRDAETPENKTLGRSPNGLKTNNTERHFGLREVLRDLSALLGRKTDYGVGATSFYNPSNRQTETGTVREPIFGLANELGEMINANNGTWGLPNSKDNDNRSIWFENQAREAYGAEPRPYY